MARDKDEKELAEKVVEAARKFIADNNRAPSEQEMAAIVKSVHALSGKPLRRVRLILEMALESLAQSNDGKEVASAFELRKFIDKEFNPDTTLIKIFPPDGILTDLEKQRQSESDLADKFYAILIKMKKAGVMDDINNTFATAQNQLPPGERGAAQANVFITPIKALLHGGQAVGATQPVAFGPGGVPAKSINIFVKVDIVKDEDNFAKFVLIHEFAHWLIFAFRSYKLERPFGPHDEAFTKFVDDAYRKLRKSEGATDAQIDQEIKDHKAKAVND